MAWDSSTKVRAVKFGDIDDGTLSPSEVERAYKVILDFVNSCGIRYKIARTSLEHNSDTY